MPKDNSFEILLEQITVLLRFAQENKYKLLSPMPKDPLDENLQAELETLEKRVELFRKITERALIMSGLDEEKIKKTLGDIPKEFSPKDKKIIEKANKVRIELEQMDREFASWRNIAYIQKKREKTAGKKRAKKFKPLGGQGWMPL